MAKPNYICQHDSYSCGPTALYNISQWSAANRNRKSLIEQCGGREMMREEGTNVLIFHAMLVTFSDIDIVKIGYRCKLYDLDRHIDDGGIIAMSYLTTDCGHYAVIIGRTDKHYLVANAYEDRRVSKMSRKNMRKTLDRDDFCLGTYTTSVQWFIKKVG